MKRLNFKFKKELLAIVMLWYSTSDFLRHANAEDVCNSEQETCPSSDCCRPSKCAEENALDGGNIKCCDQATLDKGEDLFCATDCAQCSKLLV